MSTKIEGMLNEISITFNIPVNVIRDRIKLENGVIKELDLTGINFDQIHKNSGNYNIEIEIMILNNNNIKKIETDSFENYIIKFLMMKNCNLHISSFINSKFPKINCVGLELSDNKLDIPSSFFDEVGENIEYLTLNNNDISKIPYLNHLGNIKVLSLRNNKITKVSKNSFDSLNSMITLDLSNNKIKEIDENIFSQLKKLGTLYLQNNQLQKLPKSIIELENLYHLKTFQEGKPSSLSIEQRFDFEIIGKTWESTKMKKKLHEVLI